MKEPKFQLICFTLILLFTSPTFAQSGSVSYSVVQDTIFLNQQLTLKVKVENADFDQLTPPDFPEIPGFKPLQTGNQSLFSNKELTKSYTRGYIPNRAGTFAVPAFRYPYGGESILCPATIVVVLPGKGPGIPKSSFDVFWGNSQRKYIDPESKGDEPGAPKK